MKWIILLSVICVTLGSPARQIDDHANTDEERFLGFNTDSMSVFIVDWDLGPTLIKLVHYRVNIKISIFSTQFGMLA